MTTCAAMMQAAMNRLLACWWPSESFSPSSGSMAALAKWNSVIDIVNSSKGRFSNKTLSFVGLWSVLPSSEPRDSS